MESFCFVAGEFSDPAARGERRRVGGCAAEVRGALRGQRPAVQGGPQEGLRDPLQLNQQVPGIGLNVIFKCYVIFNYDILRDFLKTRFSRCMLYRRNAAIRTD